ncbi:hypothetical protein ABZ671_02795 [Micromonospora sp. NPDC006766]|uniref:hypothetical protein n=1 Tax=Micromonospora sp. NPDC006766 TaxID=3154778 RepID=UPI00340DF119
MLVALWATGAQATADLPSNAAAGTAVAMTAMAQSASPPTGQGDEQTGTMQIVVSIAPKPTPSGGTSPTASPTATASPTTTGSPSPGGTLPRTGAAIGALVIVGAALVGGGAVLRMLARRRREPLS